MIHRVRNKDIAIPSTATACGWFNEACVAGPPSPEKPAFPVPARMERVPALSTLSTRELLISVRYRFPVLSTVTPTTEPTGATTAGTGLAGKVKSVPTTVLMIPCAKVTGPITGGMRD